jgi:hypothetical protein
MIGLVWRDYLLTTDDEPRFTDLKLDESRIDLYIKVLYIYLKM